MTCDWTTPAAAHDGPLSIDVTIASPVADVAGTLLLPHAHDKVPCVVIVGGTLSHDRNGKLFAKDAPDRDALKRLAEALAVAGYASLRYDKVGYGGSKQNKAWTGSYGDEARVAAAAIEFARRRDEISKVIAAGESSGGYVACLAAKDGAAADAYIFLGALCGSSEEMYAYTFGGFVQWAESSPERLAWAEKNRRRDLALGRTYKTMLAAAADGKNEIELVDGDYRFTMGGLFRRREELRFPPDEMFKQIHAPTLALQGEHDLNVSPKHAAKIAEIVAGGVSEDVKKQVKYVTIAGADHSFQSTPIDEDLRYRERYTLESLRRPYSPRLYGEIVLWLAKVAPTTSQGHSPAEVAAASRDAQDHGHKDGHDHSDGKKPSADPADRRAVAKTEVDAKTDTTPERIALAPGIEIIDDVTSREKTAGVDTLEGRIGPLLLATGCQAHFIDMPGGMYVEEHAHSTESIIYTVRGQWVLCSSGRRHLMKPGTLFRFTAGTPTGFEVPFDEDAFILIFKGDRTTKVEGEFVDYLKGMAERLKKEHAAGTPFLLSELPADHAARKFARAVNPKFDGGAP
ncbi:MAG: alpha/beta fold hydrolase [Pirellulales bacterium]